MAHVELNDDSIRRYVVQHYRYDPERRETRHVQVAVVDNEREYRVEYERANAVLEGRRARGEVVDPREHINGAFREPGYNRRAAHGHLLTRALRHGVRMGDWVNDLDLPSNIGGVRSSKTGPPDASHD